MLVKILKNGGEDVASNELIAEIDTDGQAAPAPPEPDAEDASTRPAAEAAPVEPDAAQLPGDEARDVATPAENGTEPAGERQQPLLPELKPKSSPAVRKLLGEHGLDAGDIPAGGDRLTKKDVLDYLEKRGEDEQGAQDGEQADADKAPVTEEEAAKPAPGEDSGSTLADVEKHVDKPRATARRSTETGSRAGAGKRRKTRPHDPPAPARGGAPAGGATGKRHPDYIQRGQHETGNGLAQPVQGQF